VQTKTHYDPEAPEYPNFPGASFLAAIAMRDPAIILIIGIAVGVAAGYGIRELISRRRRRIARERRELGMD
jgi:hypothetical protein